MDTHRTHLMSDAYASIYGEGFKPMDQNKMQDKAAMKPDTAKGEKQARKIDKVRAVAKYAGPEQEEGAKLQSKLNKVNPLKRAFKKPSFDKTKNKAYGLEQKRRADLDKRYGPKKEDLNNAYISIYANREVETLGENRRAAGAAGAYKDDSKKQTDPSKDGFTGISGSIKDIMKQNKEIEAKNKAKTTNEEKEGKKDACYNKVKSRYDVWPSAYASGALVKCRKAGAKNWGNSSKKEEVTHLDAVATFFIENNYALNEDSAFDMAAHISDDFFSEIVEEMLDEANADQGVSGDEAMKRHGIKAHEGPMKVTKLKPRGMRKGEGLGVKGRHSGINRRGQAATPVGKGGDEGQIEGGNGRGSMKPN